MDDVQRVVCDLDWPRIGDRIGWRPKYKDARALTEPVRPFRAATVQRGHHQFRRTVTIDVGPPDAVQRRLLGD